MGRGSLKFLLDSDVKVWNAKPKYKLLSSLALCSSPRLRGPYCSSPQSPQSSCQSRTLPAWPLQGHYSLTCGFQAGGLEWGGGSRDRAKALQANPPSWVWDPGRAGLPFHCPHLTNQDNNDTSSKTALETCAVCCVAIRFQ